MSDVVGSIRKVTIDGVTYDAFPDTNIKEVASLYKNEALATSGRNLRKMTKQVTQRESVVIACNGNELEVLKAVSESVDDINLSYTTASGDVYYCTGWIELESRETEENKTAVSMFPRDDWSAFLE